MNSLERRLDRLESVALPEDEMLYCFMYEEDGVRSKFGAPNPRCPHSLAEPVREICENCHAKKIIFKMVD